MKRIPNASPYCHSWLAGFVAAVALALCLVAVSVSPVLAQVDIVGETPATPEPGEPGATAPIRATRISGSLPNQYSAHYLGLQPIIRDQPIDLTFSFDPQDPLLRGKVNFIVLTEDGLRRFLAGADPQDLDVAAGAPVQFTGAQNLMQARLLDSGRGNYTVIVFNESTTPISYELLADNGVLLDTSGQVLADAADIVPEPTPTPGPVPYGPVTVTGRRLSGELDGVFERHYLQVAPEVVDGVVNLRLEVAQRMQPDLTGEINFWVLDEEGFRRLVAGASPGDVNLATGFPSPFGALGELVAAFQSSGDSEYTAVMYNDSGEPAAYAVSADGALLIDRYGQTNESVAAAAEEAALAATPEPVILDVGGEETPGIVRPNVLSGALSQPYEKHYLGLVPDVRNGMVTVLLDYDPRNVDALRNNINFWVLDQDGLRRVIAGARPEDYDIATGALVPGGPDEGKLRADFNASGRNEYTLIVYNNSEIPATYTVETRGAGMEDGIGQTVAQ